MKIDGFPMIKSCALEMARDNGMINREHSEQEYLELVDDVIGADGVYENDLNRLEAWLASLTAEARSLLMTGEETEQFEIAETCPTNAEGYPLSNIFTDIFEA